MGKTTDDTPFHLRMECLKMAQDNLGLRMHMTNDVHGKEGTEFFSTEDVLTEAAKLYKFVCDRNAAENYGRRPENDG